MAAATVARRWLVTAITLAFLVAGCGPAERAPLPPLSSSNSSVGGVPSSMASTPDPTEPGTPSGRVVPDVAHRWRIEPEAVAVAVDERGRIYTVANEYTEDGSHAILRAYASDGSFRWERLWGSATVSVYALDVAASPNGMVAVTGRIQPIDPGVPCDEIWSYGWAVRTWGAAGSVRWQRAQTGWRTCRVGATTGWAVSVGLDSVVVAAEQSDEYSGVASLIAFDLGGRTLWTRRIDVPGSENELIHDVAIGRDGSVFAALTRNLGFMDSGEGEERALIMRFLADGSLRWRRTLPGGASDSGAGTSRSSSVALHGATILAGAIVDQRAQPTDALIGAFGIDGRFLWERTFPGPYLGRADWRAVLVGSWRHGAILAGTERNADGVGTHVIVWGFDLSGGLRWRVRLGPTGESPWGATALGAAGDTIVVAGRPAGARDHWCRIWLLEP